MAHSHKLLKQFGAVGVGQHLITGDTDGINLGSADVGDVVGPSSSTANALARFSGTAGKTVKNSSLTLSDAGVLASTAAIDISTSATAADALKLTSAGGLTVSATALAFPKGTVTQATSITTGVTINTPAGVITTVSATTAAGATSTFTVTNAACLATSVVLASWAYGGTLGTNGVPVVSINSVSAGSFTVNISNVDATNALSGTLKVYFLIV